MAKKPSVDKLMDELILALEVPSSHVWINEGWSILSIESSIPQSELEEACQAEGAKLAIQNLRERVGEPFEVQIRGGHSIWGGLLGDPDSKPTRLQ